jgi:hypothetical protein
LGLLGAELFLDAVEALRVVVFFGEPSVTDRFALADRLPLLVDSKSLVEALALRDLVLV